MSNTHHGSYPTTTEAMMRAFDALPPAARKALADAIENWVPQPLLTRYRRGQFRAGGEIAAIIGRWDRNELVKRQEQRRRAAGAYKGNAPEKPNADPSNASRP